MFFRNKPVGSYRYLQIVHSVREGKKVRQQVIATLGRLDLLEASGQLERLMRSGLRHCQSFAVIDAHAAGEIQPVAIRRIGPDLVFARLWKPTGALRCNKDLIEEALFERRRDLFTEVELVFFDTTSLYFEGCGGESIGQRGHNKDHR